MFKLIIASFFFISINSFGQLQTSSQLYDKIVSDICNCTKNCPENRISPVIDSCYLVSIKNNYAALQHLGYDSTDKTSLSNLTSKLIYPRIEKNCPETFAKFNNQFHSIEKGELKFTGKFISQTPDYKNKCYRLVLQSNETNEKKEFKNAFSINEEDRGDIITATYRTKKNKKTNKKEFEIITTSSYGARPVKRR
jgi:hypothetical protein